MACFPHEKPISISVTNVWEMQAEGNVETVNSKCEGREGDLAATEAVVRGAFRLCCKGEIRKPMIEGLHIPGKEIFI